MFFEKELESNVVMEGKSVVLSCEVSSATVPVTWKKDACLVTDGERFIVKKKGPVHTLEIEKLSLEDAGEYSCITRGKKTTAMLVVKGRPNPILVGAEVNLQYCISSLNLQNYRSTMSLSFTLFWYVISVGRG